MATTKLGNTKQASRAINYAEKRATVKGGWNVNVEFAKSEMKFTRSSFGKDSGIQAHTIIQSFSPEESKGLGAVTINELGVELARKVAPEFEVAVYTHTDKEHIHNHIVINAVSFETGKKYQSNKAQRELVKTKNDEIARAFGLSVPEKKAEIRYTQAESEIAQDGRDSWKVDIREKVELYRTTMELERSESSFKAFMMERGINVSFRGKNVTYEHLEANRKVRGAKLGGRFDKEALDKMFGSKEKELEKDKQRRYKEYLRQQGRRLEY
ncbi:relaxase/mobilization nuclease domain-containing protein (plasmid) [Enterococcus faecium]